MRRRHPDILIRARGDAWLRRRLWHRGAKRITLASAMGTCFGVEHAIRMALDPAWKGRLTVVGELVHNPQVIDRLRREGVAIVEREAIDQVATEAVMVTAHGASEGFKANLSRRFTVCDATCPLVMQLHRKALAMQAEGFFVVVIGQADHIEVRGVVGNLGDCAVVAKVEDLGQLAGRSRLGVVSQTTNRPEKVEELVTRMRELPWHPEVKYVDTICSPVKARQRAIEDLLEQDIDLGIVIGGFQSSNTRKLVDLIKDHGIAVHHVERAADLRRSWFAGHRRIGITAGTSTPQDVIRSVHLAVRRMARLDPVGRFRS